MSAIRTALIAVPFLVAAPGLATAQDVDAMPDPEEISGDMTTIGVGAAYGPDYEGSDDYRFIPGAILRTQLGGVSIVTRGLYLYADVAPKGDGAVSLDAGPIAGLRLSRTGDVKDEIVDQLPERKTAIEVGAFGGASISGLTNPYDKLSFRVDALTDVNGAWDGWNFSPSVTFATPLSRKAYASASVGLDYVSDNFAMTYFGITPTENALVPELPVYDIDGGLKNWKLGLLAAHSIGDGDLLSGWQVFANASYKKLVGDFADSPIVADRGSSGQWFVAAGVGYTF
ncbi:MipA/OmpV family protein [Sphingomicrobium clamense]|uniref:MipA/OmpV family protein n=1 Tax=Sphingomicrobium clamense TaxID=2851013 RepID=A0ABS6V3B7_9SPHN|nr:MipA/OmpV family protein [Sphingomicrobium sp. B8]MBW0144043.1 MipA/OmpV family protein [Sphingomicrobium sp. B8]